MRQKQIDPRHHRFSRDRGFRSRRLPQSSALALAWPRWTGWPARADWPRPNLNDQRQDRRVAILPRSASAPVRSVGPRGRRREIRAPLLDQARELVSTPAQRSSSSGPQRDVNLIPHTLTCSGWIRGCFRFITPEIHVWCGVILLATFDHTPITPNRSSVIPVSIWHI